MSTCGDGDRRRDEQRDAADDRDHQQRFGREQRIDAADQEHAGGDHRRRVNERGDGRGAFHRVGQPHVQRELGAFADAAAEDADAGDEQQPMARFARVVGSQAATSAVIAALTAAGSLPTFCRTTSAILSRASNAIMPSVGASL